VIPPRAGEPSLEVSWPRPVAGNTGRKEIAVRLYRRNTIEKAKAEMLSILADPESIRTSGLSGAKAFPGGRTFRNPQIIKLLRSMPDRVRESWAGEGHRVFLWWKVKA
jgi:hypothetical protein